MMDRIAIEFISVFGQPPVEFIELAAQLGCRNIGLAMAPVVTYDGAWPAWSLRGDKALQQATASALKDNGVSISLGEGFLIRPGADIASAATDMDVLAGLGAARVNICSIESDHARNVDQFASFAQMAAARGMDATLEYLPATAIGHLGAALELLAAAAQPNGRLLIDAMHFFRTGSTVDDLKAIAPELIGYAQICDVPLVSAFANYADEARAERLAPGAGELPLADYVNALPASTIIGLEVPMQAKAQAGISGYDRLKPAMDATRTLLAT